ncbi:putative toxin-antitoxin system toxin component, PIN family [Candidatus Saccharibacteria bacterium]|nr:putative toxin-antitoxin system toxin component, PIN family [Candidatus Saccharibacteria bacterium]
MTTAPKLRVVIDTNVWISALVFGGNPGKILDLFVDRGIEAVISTEGLSELRRKIIQKFPLYTPQLGLLEESLRQDAELVKLGAHTVKVSPDADDNKFIETALIGHCDYIISGDRHLLGLKSYQGIKIVKPAEFLHRRGKAVGN